jgi:tRNA(His) guanylyltransferase
MSAGDALGDRMKRYEAASTGRRLMDYCPAIVRIDGRAFHTFTRGLSRPFDADLMAAMDSATAELVADFAPLVGYVQSDEVSLLFSQPTIKSELPFCGRVQKLESVLASAMTLAFNKAARVHLPIGYHDLATFDARAWSVPNEDEAANYFLWRERDATRNSISSLAQAHFSARQLHGCSTTKMLNMLEEKGIVWGEFSAREKRGQFFHREVYELQPGSLRTRVVRMGMPPFGKVTNRSGALFRSEPPAVAE